MSITGLLNNAETWNLNKGDTELLEKSEIQSIKHLFDLPLHTPNTAIIHTFGTLYTKQRIDQKQLLYLHRIMSRDTTHWTRMTLTTLKDKNIGWYANNINTLTENQLPTDFTVIKNTPFNVWKFKVQNK